MVRGTIFGHHGTTGHQERLHRSVLVLNSSFEPIHVCAARRALVLVLKGVAAAVQPAHQPALDASARQELRSVAEVSILLRCGQKRGSSWRVSHVWGSLLSRSLRRSRAPSPIPTGHRKGRLDSGQERRYKRSGARNRFVQGRIFHSPLPAGTYDLAVIMPCCQYGTFNQPGVVVRAGESRRLNIRLPWGANLGTLARRSHPSAE